MIKKLNIKSMMLVFIMGIAILSYVITFTFIGYKLRTNAIDDAKDMADNFTARVANQVKTRLDEDLAIARSMAQTLTNAGTTDTEKRELLTYEVLSNVLKGNPDYEGTWMSWDLINIDSGWNQPYGRQRTTLYLDGDNFGFDRDTVEAEGYNTEGLYYKIKQAKEEVVTEPYFFDDYAAGDAVQKLGTSACVPVLKDGNFLGMVGSDISLESFMEVTKVKDYDHGYMFLASRNGSIVAHPDKELITTGFEGLPILESNLVEIESALEQSGSVSFMTTENGETVYVSMSAIPLGRSSSPWAIFMVIPYNDIVSEVNSTIITNIIFVLIGLAILAFVIWRIGTFLSASINKAKDQLNQLADGDLDGTNDIATDREDEIGEMGKSLTRLRADLEKKVDFAKQIGEGDLEAEYVETSDKDTLGKELIHMRDSLKAAREDEEKRTWTAEGLAKFGELIQSESENIEEFSYSMISNLIKYVDANQGGLFLVQDDNPEDTHIQLMAAYAYNRQKFLDKRLELHEGLVGQCLDEKERIFMTDIPDEYINITSGLGDSNPSCLLLVPLKVNNEIYGVVELASFKTFEDFEIEFIEKVSEAIASNISKVKVAEKTKTLLEQTQLQTEQLKEQEEEMRQNMEELMATQEEMDRIIKEERGQEQEQD